MKKGSEGFLFCSFVYTNSRKNRLFKIYFAIKSIFNTNCCLQLEKLKIIMPFVSLLFWTLPYYLFFNLIFLIPSGIIIFIFQIFLVLFVGDT